MTGILWSAPKRCRDAKARQRVFHQADVAAVHLRRRHNVIALPENGRNCTECCSHTRGGTDRGRTAFECSDALLENTHGWVGDARIRMTTTLQVEDRRSRIGVGEYVRRRLIDRCRTGAELGIDHLASV